MRGQGAGKIANKLLLKISALSFFLKINIFSVVDWVHTPLETIAWLF
jgi:hypothetical protein